MAKKNKVREEDTLEMYVQTEDGTRIGTAVRFEHNIPFDLFESSIDEMIRALRDLLEREGKISQKVCISFGITKTPCSD